MAHRKRIPDFFDPESRRLTESILSGQTPLVDVNRPGVSPNVLRFFQDPKNQALITRPLAGGLDRVANQAAVDARVPAAQAQLTSRKGIPRSRPGETREQMETRLRRGGQTQARANFNAFSRFRLDEQRQERITASQQQLSELDERRKAAGLPTSQERTAQRREAQGRILDRRVPGVRAEINRRRIAQGRKPFGPVVQDEPIQIQSLDEVDPTVHGSGQILQTPDGEFFRFNDINGVQSFTPQRIEPRTGQLVTDTSQIEIGEFKESLTNTEREVRRGLIAESGTLFARDLRAIQNNIAAIERAKSAGTTASQTAQEEIEKLRDDEAELMFQFDATIGFSAAFEAESEADIAQQEAETKAAEVEQKRQDDAAKIQAKAVADTLKAVRTDKGDVDEEELESETKKRLQLQRKLVSQEKDRLESLESLRPPRQGTPILRHDVVVITRHVRRFHPELKKEDRRKRAIEIAEQLGFIAE